MASDLAVMLYRMQLLLSSFSRAILYCMHPRVIGLSIFPLVLMGGAAFGLGYFFWEPALDWVRAGLDSYEMLGTLWAWLQSLGVGNLKTVLAPLIVIFAVTPILVLVFGIAPQTAVGTDLLYAAATKTGGSLIHGLGKSIHWPAVMRLACGSLPASIMTMLVMWQLQLDTSSQRSLINLVLCFALLLTATSLIFRKAIMERYRQRLTQVEGKTTTVATVLTGAVLGMLVSISSVGAGAVGVTALLLLYPRLPMARIVGSDIAHAVPLTLVAGLGHASLGSVDWPLLAKLLAGSLPGIWVGSHLMPRTPERLIRSVLSLLLAYAGTKLVLL